MSERVLLDERPARQTATITITSHSNHSIIVKVCELEPESMLNRKQSLRRIVVKVSRKFSFCDRWRHLGLWHYAIYCDATLISFIIISWI